MATTTDVASRPRLDRRQVLAAALALVDRDGFEALSLRRLGAALGVDPMAIYRHVEGKDGLEAGLAELLWEEIARPEPGDDPNDALRRLAYSLRDLFRRHPAAAPLVLRSSDLPRSELELFRAYLDSLTAGGLPEPARVLRPLVAYALGSGYTESTMLSGRCNAGDCSTASERDRLIALGQTLSPRTPPDLTAAAVALITDCDPERCFADGLEFMLAGLAQRGSGPRPPLSESGALP